MEFLSILILIFGIIYSRPLLKLLNQEVQFRAIKLKQLKQGSKELIDSDVC